jgi:hypothetical protein
MNAAHTIRVDPRQKLVDITLTGFFDVARVIQVAIEAKAAVDSLALAPHQHLTLIDVSNFSLQSQDVVAALQSTFGNPLYASRRLAVITDKSLSSMQVQRVLKRDTAQWFDDRCEAEAWLCDDRPTQSP